MIRVVLGRTQVDVVKAVLPLVTEKRVRKLSRSVLLAEIQAIRVLLACWRPAMPPANPDTSIDLKSLFPAPGVDQFNGNGTLPTPAASFRFDMNSRLLVKKVLPVSNDRK